MKTQDAPSGISRQLPVVLFFLLYFINQPAQSQVQQFGFYRLNIPPGWVYDAQNSGDRFYTFNYNGSGGSPGYVVRLEKQTFPCASKRDLNKAMRAMFSKMYGTDEQIDKYSQESEYSVLGDPNCHMMSYAAKNTGERTSIFSPLVNGQMVHIYITDKTNAGSEPQAPPNNGKLIGITKLNQISLRPEALAFFNALQANGQVSSPVATGMQPAIVESQAVTNPQSNPGNKTPDPATAVTTGGTESIAGIYRTDWAEMMLVQSGNQVKGTYKFSGGSLEGTLEGHTLAGMWYQTNGKGRFRFEFDNGFSTFTGKFGYNDEEPSKSWNGTKTAEKPGTAAQVNEGNPQVAGNENGKQNQSGHINPAESPDNKNNAIAAGNPASPSEKEKQVPNQEAAESKIANIPPPSLAIGKINFESDIDFANMTSAQYTGAVSMAMEGMRLVYGEMADSEEVRFEKTWLPLFKYPCKEVVEYLNNVNPLISKFLAIREVMASEMEAYNAASMEVTASMAEDDLDQVAATMQEIEITVANLNTLQLQMQEIVDAISSLGNPPDPDALAEKRQKLHHKALSMISADNFPFEGEWETEAGDHILMRVLKTYDDGKVLVYCFPVTTLQEWEEKGIDITQPGISYDENRKGMTMIPGIYDLLKVFEPLDDGSWAELDWSFVRIVSIYSPVENNEIDILQYTPPNELSDESHVSKYSLTKTKETYEVPPVLPIDSKPAKWAQLQTIVPERKWDKNKYDQYQRWTTEYPEDLPMAIQEGPTPQQERMRFYLKEKAQIEAEDKALKERGVVLDTTTILYMARINWGMDGVPASERPQLEKELLAKRGNEKQKEIDSFYGLKMQELNAKYADLFEPVDPADAPKPEVTIELIDYLKSLKEWETAEAIKKQQEQEIKFHENNVKYFNKNIESLKARLSEGGNSLDKDTRDRMERDMLYQLDSRQKEEDAIMSAKTGQYIHTRTDLDAKNMQMMMASGMKMAEKAHQEKRTWERLPQLILMADPSDRARLTDFVQKNCYEPGTNKLDPERVIQVEKAIRGQVDDQLALKAKQTREDADLAEAKLTALEYVKTGADVSLLILSTVAPVCYAYTAPNAIAMGMRITRAARLFTAYQGITGTCEGGLKEGFVRAASTYNAATMMANAAINGYHQGVLNQLEENAKDPSKAKTDETSAGLWNMGWEIGKEALRTVVFKTALGAIMPAKPNSGPAQWGDVANAKGMPAGTSQQQWPTIRQQLNEANFVSRQADGRAKVSLFQERARKLAEAGKAGSPKEEILQLRSDMENAYTVVKTDYFAKMHVNALARQGDSKTTAYYNSCERKYLSQLTAAVDGEMAAAGYNKQQYQSYSNSSSKGKAGMDLDFGVVEPPRYIIDAGGKKIPNPEHITWRQNITQTVEGIPIRRSPEDLRAAGQSALEKAFEKTYGRPAGEAMVQFTTSYHPEAYRDLAWLGRKGTKSAMVFETDKAWVQQAADVSAFKVNKIPVDHPELGYYGQLQEQMRGLTKDFDTKIQPMLRLKAKSNPEATQHLTELRNTMNDFAQNKIGPLEADRKIMELTGGKGIAEVAEQLGVAMKSLRSSFK